MRFVAWSTLLLSFAAFVSGATANDTMPMPGTDAGNNSTTTTTTLITSYPRTGQMQLCDAVSPVIGIVLATYLFTSTMVISRVVFMVKDVGGMYAVPRLTAFRYNLFASLWIQGLSNVLQCFRHDSGDGCFIREQYLVTSRIPSRTGPVRSAPLSDGFLDFLVFVDTLVAGYQVLLILVALPRLRCHFCPHLVPKKGRLSSLCALPAALILLLLNPVATALLVSKRLRAALLVELLLYVGGLCLAWEAGRHERAVLIRFFEHLYGQQWSVLFGAVALRAGRLLIDRVFHDATARFMMAFVSVVATMIVSSHLVFTAPPWKDPLIWLAGQEWQNSQEKEAASKDKAKASKARKKDRLAVLRFASCIFNWRRMLALTLSYEYERLGKDKPWVAWLSRTGLETEPAPKPQPTPGGEGSRSAGEASSGTAAAPRPPLEPQELRFGKAACEEWMAWAERVSAWWPGVRTGRAAPDVTDVDPPTKPTPAEAELGKQARWNRWRFVLGDFFSDRVHSRELAVLQAAAFLIREEFWTAMTVVAFNGVDESIALLIQGLVACGLVWLLLGLTLLGNNVFLPFPFVSFRNGRRIWLAGLALINFLLLVSLLMELWAFAHDGESPLTAGSPLTLYPSVTVYYGGLKMLLTGWAFSTSIRLLLADYCPEVQNTFHRQEFAAQRHCQTLLGGTLRCAKQGARVLEDEKAHELTDQVFQVRWAGARRPCRVTGTNADGTCSLVLQGGQMLQNVLLKCLEALPTDARLVRKDREQLGSFLSSVKPALQLIPAQVQSVFSPVKYLLNTPKKSPVDQGRSLLEEPSSGAEGTDTSNGKEPVEQEMPIERPKTQPVGREPSGFEASSPLTKSARPTAFEAYRRRALSTEGGAMLKQMATGEFTEDAALVTIACDRGMKRAGEIKRQRMHALGRHIFFNSSVGLSSLMLVSLILGPLILLGATTYLAARASFFERRVARLQSAAAYVYRVQNRSFHPGACEPLLREEERACVRELGEGPCSSMGALLFEAFDDDGSNALEPPELNSMSRVVSTAGFAAAAGGREVSALLRRDVRAIARQAAPPGMDVLQEPDVERFVCLLSKQLTMLNREYELAWNNGTVGNLTVGELFAIADQDQDGFLTQGELQSLVPVRNLAQFPESQQAMDVYNLAIRVAFLFGDTQPADGRLSKDEATTAVAHALRLMRNLSQLAAQIAAVRSGQQESFDASAVLAALDVDGDGTVTRSEASIMASLMEIATGSTQVSSLVLSAFDRVDTDGDGMIQQADMQSMMQQLAAALILVEMMATQDASTLSSDKLLTALDQNSDGKLSRTEFDRLSSFLPSEYSSQASFLVSLVFSQADAAPSDGQLDSAELQTAVQRMQSLLQQLSQDSGSTAPSRRLQRGAQSIANAVNNPEETREQMQENMFDIGEVLIRMALTSITGEDEEEIDRNLQRFLRALNSEAFRTVIPFIFLALRLAILLALVNSMNMMMQTKNEHEKLTRQIQGGDHSYVGANQPELLRNSFSASSSFPSIFVATIVLHYAVASIVFFFCLSIILTPVVLFIIPSTRFLPIAFLLVFRFVIFAALVRMALKYLVVDYMIVEHGHPVRPGLFSCLWVMLVLLNFVQAGFNAVFRWVTLVFTATLTANHLYVCGVPESILSFDPGYYAFISLTFTQASRRNLVRNCFVSALMPQACRLQSAKPPQSADLESEEAIARRRRLRLRNKLWVAVTLWNNPELRQYRRVSQEREFGSLMSLWEGGQPEDEASGKQS